MRDGASEGDGRRSKGADRVEGGVMYGRKKGGVIAVRRAVRGEAGWGGGRRLGELLSSSGNLSPSSSTDGQAKIPREPPPVMT